jgi:hypothetical protein
LPRKNSLAEFLTKQITNHKIPGNEINVYAYKTLFGFFSGCTDDGRTFRRQ